MTDDHREEGERFLRMLMAAHSGPVKGLIARFELDQMIREELLADVFCLAWQRRDVLVRLSDGEVRGWLLRSAQFRCANSARKGEARRRLFDQLCREPLPIAASPEEVFDDRQSEAMRRERSAAIGAAFDAVGSDDRVVLVLHLLGMSGPQIAEELGVTHQVVRHRLRLARRRFRAAYVVPGADGGPGRASS